MTTVLRALALPALACLLVGPAAASEGTSSALTIVVDLVVEDTRGRPVTDLKAGEVVVAQDQVQQKIARFTPKERPGHYELVYAPSSGKPGRVTVMLKRLGTRARGVDGPVLKPRVVLPTSTLASELGRLLETRPDASDFPMLASVLRFEAAADGVHHTLAVEVPIGGLAGPDAAVPADRLQIYARVSDAEGRVVRQFDLERSLTTAAPAQSAVQRLVWTGQLHLRRGRYVLDTVAREPRSGRAAVRRVTFESREPAAGLGLSSVALLHPMESLTVRDQGQEADDPLLLGGEPLMPVFDLKTSAAPGVKVEFFTVVYPDHVRPEPVSLTLEVVREQKVVATVPLALPPADERGEIRYAGGMATRTLSPADYRLRLVARQGDAQAAEETSFTVRDDAHATPVRVGAVPPPNPPPPGLPALPEVGEARMHLVRQDYARAIQALKAADKSTSGTRADVAILLAVAYFRAGAHKDAEVAARRAIDLAKGTPALAEAYLVLGRALAAAESKPVRRDSEKLRAAEQAFRQALAAGNPRDDTCQLALAEALFRLERGEEARTVLESLRGSPGASSESLARAQQLLRSPRCVSEGCLPPLSFVSVDGQHGTSEDLRGKAVLLTFWATWCKPCVEAVPELRRLHAKYANEPFAMIGVNVDHDRDAAKAFAQANGVTWPQTIEGGSGGLAEAAAAQGIPLELLFDHEGVLLARSKGWGPDSSRVLAAHIGSAVGKAKKARERAQPAP